MDEITKTFDEFAAILDRIKEDAQFKKMDVEEATNAQVYRDHLIKFAINELKKEKGKNVHWLTKKGRLLERKFPPTKSDE